MVLESSYGIIPLKRMDAAWQVLLIKHLSGKHWGFPKGHPEKGETPQQAAVRELQEETGLRIIRFISDKALVEKYRFYAKSSHVHKTVSYFVAEVEGDVVLQSQEVAESKWVPLEDAPKHVTFDEARSICMKAINLLADT